MPSSRFALCLNSSFLGFYAHAGFLGELTELGIRPVAVSGASAGALVAGLYAAGVSPDEMAAMFLQPKFHHVFRELGAPGRALAMLANRPGHTGILRGHRGLSLLRARLGDRRIEDCTDPRLALAVTNLAAGRAEVLTAGPLAEHILGSGAFPGLFAARSVGTGTYWDGGIANPLPFEHWVNDPEIDTIVLHVIENLVERDVRAPVRPLTIADAFNLSHQIICDELLRLKTALVERAGKRLLTFRTLAPRPGFWNARAIGPVCLECGRSTGRENRARLKELAA